jgi:hypothetical protein
MVVVGLGGVLEGLPANMPAGQDAWQFSLCRRGGPGAPCYSQYFILLNVIRSDVIVALAATITKESRRV